MAESIDDRSAFVNKLAEQLWESYWRATMPDLNVKWANVHEDTRAGWRAVAERASNVTPDTDRQSKGWEAMWEAAKLLDQELSGLSWNGFNIAGDRKSIDEVRRLMHLEERLRWFEKHHEVCRGEGFF